MLMHVEMCRPRFGLACLKGLSRGHFFILQLMTQKIILFTHLLSCLQMRGCTSFLSTHFDYDNFKLIREHTFQMCLVTFKISLDLLINCTYSDLL